MFSTWLYSEVSNAYLACPWPLKNYNFALVKIQILAFAVTLFKCLYLNNLPRFVLTFIFGSTSCVTPTYFFCRLVFLFLCILNSWSTAAWDQTSASPALIFHSSALPPAPRSSSLDMLRFLPLSSPLLFSSPLLIYPFTALPLFHPGCFSLLRPQNFTAHSL